MGHVKRTRLLRGRYFVTLNARKDIRIKKGKMTGGHQSEAQFAAQFAAQFGEKRFQTAEVSLNYVEGPDNGPTIVLLHGVTSRWQPFLAIMPELAKHFHVFALDLRGHGRSGHTPGAYQLDDFSGDVQEFIGEKVLAPAAIYGHSLGGLVGINLAARYPQSVRMLILGDPPLYYHDTATRDTIWQQAFSELLDFMSAQRSSAEREAWLAENVPGMSRERREERVRSLEEFDPEVVRVVLSDTLMDGISLSHLALRVACPVILLRGNEKLGSALREQDVIFAKRHFADIRVIEMESVGHGIIPNTLLAKLMKFIDGNQG